MSTWSRTAALAASFACLTGCIDDADPRVDPDLGDESAQTLGRVHVVVDEVASNEMVPGSVSSFVEVTARFAIYRGLDEEFVRARVDAPVSALDVLRPGQCVPTDQLRARETADPDGTDPRELVLLDAGELAVTIGEGAPVSIPVSLVPDLLPYMSGVEYVYLSDATPTPLVELPTRALPVQVAAGGAAEELADFRVTGELPPPLGLEVRYTGDELTLQWSAAPGNEANVVVTLAGDGENAPAEITCVLSDVGAGQIDVGSLSLQGLDVRATEFLVARMSRIDRRTFDAGAFVGLELVVEARDTATVGANPP